MTCRMKKIVREENNGEKTHFERQNIYQNIGKKTAVLDVANVPNSIQLSL